MAPLTEAPLWLGLDASRNGDSVTIQAGERRICLNVTEGARSAKVDDKESNLQQPLEQKDDVMYLPVRWLCEAAGASIAGTCNYRAYTIKRGEKAALLPVGFVPYDSVGLVVLGGLKPSRHEAVQLRIKDQLKQQGIKTVLLNTADQAKAKNLPAVIVANYSADGKASNLQISLLDSNLAPTPWTRTVRGEAGCIVPAGARFEIRNGELIYDEKQTKKVSADEMMLSNLQDENIFTPALDTWRSYAATLN